MNVGKIPKKVLKWRGKQPAGKIMSPEKFQKIKRGAARGDGARDPAAVAGQQYWYGKEGVMAKYKKTHHSPAKPL